MKELLQQIQNHWNITADSPWYRSLRTDERIMKLAANPETAFHPQVFSLITKYLSDIKGKKILLPSSGDNHAAFAFALLGAEVTSADISQRQLENAALIAEKLQLKILFVLDNTMELSNIPNDSFDLVYTSNGTHTWIPDLNSMYQNIGRVLKKNGYSIMYDIHPFHRPFSGEPWKQPQIIKRYSDVFPDCHWRVQDLMNSTVSAGLNIVEVAELQAVNASFWYSYDELIRQTDDNLQKLNQWELNPMAALPAWLTIVSQKQHPC